MRRSREATYRLRLSESELLHCIWALSRSASTVEAESPLLASDYRRIAAHFSSQFGRLTFPRLLRRCATSLRRWGAERAQTTAASEERGAHGAPSAERG